jgi:hypothetical protein
MRMKVARKLQEAFNDIADGVSVSVNVDNTREYVKITARSEWYGVVLVPLSDLANKTDDEAADTMFNAAVSAVKIAVEQKNV